MTKSDEEGWVDLNNNKEIKKIINDNVVLVAPKGQRKYIVPLFCPLCEFPMKTREDSEAFLKNKTCAPCLQKWPNNHVIDFNSEEWKEYSIKRELMAKPIINLV